MVSSMRRSWDVSMGDELSIKLTTSILSLFTRVNTMSQATYTDAHRSFLQLISARRLLTAPQVNAAYEAACAKYNVGDCGGLQQFVMAINADISPMHLVIKKSMQEDLRADKSCFVLINTLSSDVLKGLSTMSAWEESLFDRIMASIVQSEEGCIHDMDAVNMGPSLTSHKVSVSDSEAAVARMVKNRLLVKVSVDSEAAVARMVKNRLLVKVSVDSEAAVARMVKNRLLVKVSVDSEAAVARMVKNRLLVKDGEMLLLSGLVLSEQQQQLEAAYPDICVKCFMCKVITLQGYCCDECNGRVHRSCGLKLWRKARRQPYCPGCNMVWPHVSDSLGGTTEQATQ
ncbi:Non-structural maintenance of chromosomes element 1 [Trinorchestia longiramus]|nr:Non-structural maintenance of chromosomes element 1 [Trinorchestia longiramus]